MTPSRATWCHWAAVKCIRRNPRTTVVATLSAIICVFIFSPGYDPIYGPCQLSVADESYSSLSNVTLGHLTLDFGRQINLRLFSSSPAAGGSVKLRAVIGRTLSSHVPYRLKTEQNQLSLVFPGSGIRLNVFRPYDDCYRITWESCTGQLRDSIRLSGAHWYGGPTVLSPRWPVSELQRPGWEAVVTGDVYKDYYGGVVERFWMSSDGTVIHVDYDVPLFVAMNHNGDGHLDIEARYGRLN